MRPHGSAAYLIGTAFEEARALQSRIEVAQEELRFERELLDEEIYHLGGALNAIDGALSALRQVLPR